MSNGATESQTIPVVLYGHLMAVAFGMDSKKDSALRQNIIKSDKLEKMAK